jgi:hypothetical protein
LGASETSKSQISAPSSAVYFDLRSATRALPSRPVK